MSWRADCWSAGFWCPGPSLGPGCEMGTRPPRSHILQSVGARWHQHNFSKARFGVKGSKNGCTLRIDVRALGLDCASVRCDCSMERDVSRSAHGPILIDPTHISTPRLPPWVGATTALIDPVAAHAEQKCPDDPDDEHFTTAGEAWILPNHKRCEHRRITVDAEDLLLWNQSWDATICQARSATLIEVGDDNVLTSFFREVAGVHAEIRCFKWSCLR